MNRQTPSPQASDGRVSLRQWARSRRVPLSTAHKGVQSGRITRDPDGKLDPARADREWYANTRPRVDMRRPVVPQTTPDREAGEDLGGMLRRELKEPFGTLSTEPCETVRVADALAVEAALEDLLAVELVAALSRAAVDIAPRLARPEDGEWLSERLSSALLDGWEATETEWRRRFPARPRNPGSPPVEIELDGSILWRQIHGREG